MFCRFVTMMKHPMLVLALTLVLTYAPVQSQSQTK
jgi:hypothetical protein